MCQEIRVTLLITTRRGNRFPDNYKIRATDSCDKRPKDTEKQKKPVLINKYYKIRALMFHLSIKITVYFREIP
ncbi:MAG TPA: hypothetical protein DCY35_08715 [Prolixibacteraceae bacterium]|nr:hypothetical protein [Prolixibacteraceae bacterium]